MLYVNSRNTDKTTIAIKIAHEMKIPVLAANKMRADIIKERSEYLKLPVTVLYPDKLTRLSKDGLGTKTKQVVIDDVDAVMKSMFGIDVVLATSRGENMEMVETP